MFALSILFAWKRSLIDAKNAFVNAPVKEEIFVCQPEGFVRKGNEDYVYLLKKSLYGLRQASRKWNMYSLNILIKNGCEQSPADQTVYLRKIGTTFVVPVRCVDDILLFSYTKKSSTDVIKHSSSHFQLQISKIIDKLFGFSIKYRETRTNLQNKPVIQSLLAIFKCRTVSHQILLCLLAWT